MIFALGNRAEQTLKGDCVHSAKSGNDEQLGEVGSQLQHYESPRRLHYRYRTSLQEIQRTALRFATWLQL